MSVSIFVMLGVEHVREQAKKSFASSVSGVDLIVGTRTSKLNLLLYSIFRIGSPVNNISWQSYQNLAQNKLVDWSVPISLGDSHKGFRVLGTTPNYFSLFGYANNQKLTFKQGENFSNIFGIVLGAQVANKLKYQLGDKVTLSHGIGNTSFKNHANLPFQVVGILTATGTPVDQALYVSLQGLEAVHMTAPINVKTLPTLAELALQKDKYLTPKSITAVMIGLKSKMTVFHFQRQINTDKHEPLTALIPGVELAKLWKTMSSFDNTLRLIAVLVFISSLIALSAMLLSSIKERLPEIKLLRMIGASTRFVFLLIELEAMLIALISLLVALGGISFVLSLMKPFILQNYGIFIEPNIISNTSSQVILGVLTCTFFAAIPPAISALYGVKNH